MLAAPADGDDSRHSAADDPCAACFRRETITPYIQPVNSTGPAPGSQASLREMNRLRVLDAVREHGALTQVEIAGVTGLSAATVSNLVKELDSAGAVLLSPSIRNGRRAVQVSVAAAHGLVAAIVFGDRDVRVALGTGGSEILSQKRMPLPADHAADEGMSRGARLVLELVRPERPLDLGDQGRRAGPAGADRHRDRSGGLRGHPAGMARRARGVGRWRTPSAPRSSSTTPPTSRPWGSRSSVRCRGSRTASSSRRPTASGPASSSAASCSAAAPAPPARSAT